MLVHVCYCVELSLCACACAANSATCFPFLRRGVPVSTKRSETAPFFRAFEAKLFFVFESIRLTITLYIETHSSPHAQVLDLQIPCFTLETVNGRNANNLHKVKT